MQLLTRLVFDRGSTDAASKVADIMCADFVHEVISACVPSVYPPRSGDGWACIPIISPSPKSGSENKVLSPSTKGVKPNHTPVMPGIPLYPLELDVVKHLIKISPVRAVLACVFGSSILYSGNTSSISSSLHSETQLAPDTKRLFFEFAVDQSERLFKTPCYFFCFSFLSLSLCKSFHRPSTVLIYLAGAGSQL